MSRVCDRLQSRSFCLMGKTDDEGAKAPFESKTEATDAKCDGVTAGGACGCAFTPPEILAFLEKLASFAVEVLRVPAWDRFQTLLANFMCFSVAWPLLQGLAVGVRLPAKCTDGDHAGTDG